MIQNLSESVVVPIAGIIITLVLCYELISMLTERNNLHDVDTWMFFKYFVKAWVAIYLVSNTFTITMAVFDVGQSVVNSASGIINGETAIDVSSLSMQMQAAMATMEIGELVVLALETLPCQLLHENYVGGDNCHCLWAHDRDLSLYIACPDPVRNDEQP